MLTVSSDNLLTPRTCRTRPTPEDGERAGSVFLHDGVRVPGYRRLCSIPLTTTPKSLVKIPRHRTPNNVVSSEKSP